MHKLKIFAAVLVAAAAATSAASAAQSTVSLNVRSGPSTSYGVVDVLYAGESVNVDHCLSNGWCAISHSGPDGWVSAHYLTDINRAPVQTRPSPPPRVNFSFSFGRGNGFSIFTGNHGGSRDLVCLVKFFHRGDVQAGADANVESATVMSRARAEAIDRPNDRFGIFDYGTNSQTRETCRYLDQLN